MKVKFLKPVTIDCGREGCDYKYTAEAGTVANVTGAILKDSEKHIEDVSAYNDFSSFKGIDIKASDKDALTVHMCADCAISKGIVEIIKE